MKEDIESLKPMDTLYQDIRQIIETSRSNAVRSVDFCRVQMYWQLGHRIFEEEQQGKERADYGKYLLQNLAKRLEPEFGSGFSYRQLKFCRQFYRTYPNRNTLRSQLNWSQYRRLRKNDTVVRMTLPENGNTILASQYQLYLPTEDQLVKEINEVKLSAENKEQ
jgi:hypothetical protein